MRRLTLVLCAFVLTMSACGKDSKTASGQPVTVFAAASLTESFNALKVTGVTPTYSFGGSGALVTQIQQGAPADVIATADEASMQTLAGAGLVENPVRFLDNKLEIVVSAGNRKSISSLADLARPDITYITEADTVPAGKYSAQILKNAGVTPSPKSKELDVKAAVTKVVTGEADATIAYVTDVRAAGDKVQGIPIPEAQNVRAHYVVAVVKNTKHHDGAVKFFDAVVRGAAHQSIIGHGFLEPS